VIAQIGDRARIAVVDRDQVVRTDEEVDVVRAEAVLASFDSMPWRMT